MNSHGISPIPQVMSLKRQHVQYLTLILELYHVHKNHSVPGNFHTRQLQLYAMAAPQTTQRQLE